MRSLRENSPERTASAAGLASRLQHSRPLSGSAIVQRRKKPSRLWGLALRGVAVAVLAAGGAFTFKYGIPVASTAAMADALAVNIGLGVDQIAVTGSRNTLSDDIFTALNIERDSSLLTYDISAARSRLEALPWVASAHVSRTLPNGLDVAIEERQPFAVWQHRQLMFLIDADGRTLEPTARADHRDLPLVVGDDADTGARDLLAMLRRFPTVAGRLSAAVRVGGRRWDLQLRDAPVLMLPEEAPEQALAWVARMDQDERLFDRRLAAIDLRVSGRVAFRVTAELPALSGKPASRAPATPNRGA